MNRKYLFLLLLVVPLFLSGCNDLVAIPNTLTFSKEHELHHVIPQAESVKNAMNKLGIDVDDYCIALPHDKHSHFHDDGNYKKYSDEWVQWLQTNPNATTKNVISFLSEKLKEKKVATSYFLRYSRKTSDDGVLCKTSGIMYSPVGGVLTDTSAKLYNVLYKPFTACWNIFWADSKSDDMEDKASALAIIFAVISLIGASFLIWLIFGYFWGCFYLVIGAYIVSVCVNDPPLLLLFGIINTLVCCFLSIYIWFF